MIDDDEGDKLAEPVGGKDRLSGPPPEQGEYSRRLSNRMQAAASLRAVRQKLQGAPQPPPVKVTWNGAR